MAKGNMLLGYSKGSVGDVTFYRSGGSQRSRARNRNPNNPRTERQQSQRSRFANAVKFYKQVTTNFFRFAYEDKAVNESDYNAFMRHNVKRSGYIGYAASKVTNWPAVGLFEVSAGSLPPVAGRAVSDVITFNFGDTATGEERAAATTIGTLSNLLITKGNGMYREGDIITLLLYCFKYRSTFPTVDTTSEGVKAESQFVQFTLNTTSTTAIASLEQTILSETILVQMASGGLQISIDGDPSSSMCVMAALIHSRNTSEGLKVSTQELIPSNATPVNAAMDTEGAYYSAVLADWNAAAEAVLQGSASVN